MEGKGFVVDFSVEDDWSIFIEVDERVAYAYFVTPTGITGDVWLFNRVDPPSEAPWELRGEGPFLNPKEYAFGYRDANSIREDDFRVMRRPGDPSRNAAVYLKGRLLAILWDGAQPGKSAFAKKTSPVALAFEDGISQAPEEWIC